NDQLELMPNIMIKWVDQAPLDADINFNVRYLDRIMGGLNYRVGGNKNGDSLGLLFYFQANQKIGAGLAYELTISDIKKYESGTLELVIRYDLRDEKTNLENPRFFKKQ
ncbi:MAG: type IX secretion system membrane protein PorP/SprF, partial [Bacteroidetes bacterium]